MDYRNLQIYRKAREVTRQVSKMIKSWPPTTQSQIIARQLFRATSSIGANIAEGHGRHTGLEYIHYLIIAQGSANEVDHWLNTAADCEICNQDQISPLILLNNETRKMLTATINTLNKQQSNKTLREPPSPYSPIPSNQEDLTDIDS
jgi:four helix bundle protein